VSAVVATPILGGGGVHGLALSLLDTAGDRIPPRRLETAEAMAGALAPVVELEALKEETAHSSAERAAFWRMTSTALGESDTWKALERVCREARHITGAGGAAILLEDEGELRVAYSAGDGAEWSDELLVQATTGRPCMVPAEPVILHDLSEKLDIPEAELIRSAVLVPLCAHGKSIGVLQIVNPRKSLQKGQLREVTQLADRVAVVVEHFQLHEKREKMVVLEERHRMARELHDSVTQSVYAVTVFAEAAAKLLERERASDAMETLRELRDVGLMALREMRSLVFELHPPGIEKLDIIDALQIRLASVEGRSGLRAALHHFGVPFLPPGIKDGLYRIAQEALNNTLKHARASKIVLWLTGTPSGIRLELEDDGVGFDLEEGLSRGGLGLSGMEERAAAMNGTIKIEARPGKGVRIIIDVPLIESGNAGVTRGTGNSERTSPGRAGDGGSTDGGEDDQSPHRG
jgi:signal transduction histidine kinase